MKTLFKNARIINPKFDMDFNGDVLVENGVVAEIAENISDEKAEIIDCTGLCLAPGLVDMHVHLRDPGFTDKEDIITASNAAAAGGVTSVLCMPNTNPVTDSAEVIGEILEKAKLSKMKVYVAASITKALNSTEETDINELKNAGAVALTDDGKPVFDTSILLNAMRKTNENGMIIVSHCEDPYLAKEWYMSEGEVSRELGLKGVPRASEDGSTAKEIAMAESVDARLHICHVSTKGSANLIRDAKARGAKISGETAPHYLLLTDEELRKKDADYRMNPPLRTVEDNEALIQAIIDGTIEVIATDHAPHTKEEKADFYKAPNGVIGMETSLSATLTALKDKVSLTKIIELMSYNPAKIIGIDAGYLEAGKPADIVVFDTEEDFYVDINKLHGKSVNAVFKNMTLKGKVKYTMLNGEIVYKD